MSVIPFSSNFLDSLETDTPSLSSRLLNLNPKNPLLRGPGGVSGVQRREVTGETEVVDHSSLVHVLVQRSHRSSTGGWGDGSGGGDEVTVGYRVGLE